MTAILKKNQKILVAGGTGFLGQRVAAKLKEEKFNVLTASLKTGVDFRDFGQTLRFFKKNKPEIVINCAAYVGGLQFGYQHPAEMFYNNILMATYFMEAARLAGVKKFINIISNCVYPAHLSKFKEEDLWAGNMHDSVLPYASARKLSWVQGWAYKKQYDFDSSHLILASMYGPGDHFDATRSHALGALIMKFVEAKRKKLPEVIIWGTGKPIREWMYVDDGAEAIVRSLKMNLGVEPVNIGRGEGISMIALAKLIKKISGYKGKITLDKTKPDGALCKIFNVDKMKKVFKWFPPMRLENGIRQTIQWYEKNL